jgi:hypothetical protein
MKTTIVSSGDLKDEIGRSNWQPEYYIPAVAQTDVDKSILETKKRVRAANLRLKKLEALKTDIDAKVAADEPIGFKIRERMVKLGLGWRR